MTARRALRGGSVVAALAASALLLFLALPTLTLLAKGGADGARGLFVDAELRGAIALTLLTATASTLLAASLGTPLAWWLARREFRGRAIVHAVLDLPLLIPHPVAGIALLVLLARGSPLGATLLALGVRVVGSPIAIVLAMLFVSAPIYVSAAREAIADVDPRYEGVARTLGDSFRESVHRVTLPMAWRGLLAAAVTAWARAASEFGAIVILAWQPRVASVLAYDRFTTYGLREALPVAAALVLIAFVPLVALRALGARRQAVASVAR
ncbi:MAG: ABC transporter permease [Gemmatimonadaceae bacterium]|nr:ABC transporter permease [Gemmatimonadaceae bacterium]NUQ91592.1 ABC transporter permease [Gemmatimonadaceae bacterium]NUS97568.1 ABC transporter permease [Gemmatimonadaceae bacterium]